MTSVLAASFCARPCAPVNGPVTSLCVDLAGDVDGLAVLGRAKQARAVVLLEGEADRIHQRVAPVAARLGSVRREALAWSTASG